MLPIPALLAKRCFRPTSRPIRVGPIQRTYGLSLAKRCFRSRPNDASSHRFFAGERRQPGIRVGEPEPQAALAEAEARSPQGGAMSPKRCPREKGRKGRALCERESTLQSAGRRSASADNFEWTAGRLCGCRGGVGPAVLASEGRLAIRVTANSTRRVGQRTNSPRVRASTPPELDASSESADIRGPRSSRD